VLDSLSDLVHIDASTAALISASLLAWVAVVYLLTAAGVRSGELVWAGRHISRLPAEQRWWSLLYGIALLGSGLVLLQLAGAINVELIPEQWLQGAGFAVTCLLAIATVAGLVRGSTWERMLFVPATLLGAGLAAWLTFG
jgi:hypothetical protein